MQPWLYVLLILLNTAGLGLWIWSWRRNRIQAGLVRHQDQHAYCASCGYDLTGRDVDKIDEIEAVQCPECGQTIQTPSDVVIPKHISDKTSHKGFALMVGSQAFFVVLMLWSFYGDLTKSSPSRTSNATLISTVTQQGATPPNISDTYELDRRLDRDELSQAEELKLLSLVLAIQADPTKPWEDKFGEWIEKGRAKGLVSDQQWQQYLAQPGIVSLTCRERIYPGDPIVLQLNADYQTMRLSLDYRRNLAPSIIEDAKIAVYADPHPKDSEPILTHEQFLSTFSPRDFVPRIDASTPLPPGKYKVVVDTEVILPDPKSSDTQASKEPIQLEAVFEVVPKDPPIIKAIKDDKLAAELQDAIYQEVLRSGGTKINSYGRLSISLKDPLSPLAGSFDVSVNIDGVQSTRSWHFAPNRKGNSWQELTFQVPDAFIERVANSDEPVPSFSVRLTPNPEHLKFEIEGYEYLDHTIWLRDIPMGLPEP